MLTIVIPTYNRNEVLLRNIQFLLPQLLPEHKLLILDNHSDTPVSETLKDVLNLYPQLDSKIIRNRINIGGNANIMRCFELCETEWLWIIGDDDRPLENAIETVSFYLRRYPANLNICFSTNVFRWENEINAAELTDYVKAINVNNGFLISSNLYHVSILTKHLSLAHQYISSCAPHFILLLLAMGEGGSCCLSTEQIVYQKVPDNKEDRASIIAISLGITSVFDVMPSKELQQCFAEKLREVTQLPRSLFLELLVVEDVPRWKKKYIFDKVTSNLNRCKFGWKKLAGRTESIIYRTLLFYFPYVAVSLLNTFFPEQFKKLKEMLPSHKEVPPRV